MNLKHNILLALVVCKANKAAHKFILVGWGEERRTIQNK
jgi:hypothetical protein